MAAIAQTIAIVDKSGKVVSTSKQLKNVFQEAKLAYRERKAEILADRKGKEERRLRKAIKGMSLAEEEARSASGRGSSGRCDTEHRARPSHSGRHSSASSVRSHNSSASEHPNRRHHSGSGHSRSHRSSNTDAYSTTRSAPVSPIDGAPPHGLVRSHTDMDIALPPKRPQALVRSNSVGAIDLDLAYGEYHPESISPLRLARQDTQQQELSSLVNKAKMLLDEAKCAQHSVKAIVAHLQKNPEAMAAVALTLAEISNLASKMAPGALAAIKTGAPSIFALLAAPEFLIAVGVGIGVTVVMFGGYKIIKKIKAKHADEKGMDEMLEIGGDIDHIERWRRGIADAESVSVGTSVEGELITPAAAASMGHLPIDPRVKEVRSGKKSKQGKGSKSGRSETSSSASGISLRDNRALVKVKKPSPLRRMFKRDDGSSNKS